MALLDKKKSPRRFAFVAALLVAGWLAQQAGVDLSALGLTGSPPASHTTPPASVDPTRTPTRPGASVPARGTGDARIERAVAARESGFMVTVDGTVRATLRDDLEGSRHQRFIVELESGRTLLVAHNIDMADRVPLARGDAVRVRGQYEWNEKGGVLHWTHHDPARRHPGGWIEFEGKRTE